MVRPAGVTIAAAIFIIAGAVIGVLACAMLIGSVGLVQHSSETTGIFANSFLGGLGLFFGTIVLVIAAVVVFIGISLWRMHRWARLSAIALLGPWAVFLALALLKSSGHATPNGFLPGVVFVATAVWIVWYLARPEVKDAFDKSGPVLIQPPVMGAPRPTPRS